MFFPPFGELWRGEIDHTVDLVQGEIRESGSFSSWVVNVPGPPSDPLSVVALTFRTLAKPSLGGLVYAGERHCGVFSQEIWGTQNGKGT